MDAFRTFLFDSPTETKGLFEMIGELWGSEPHSPSKQLDKLVDREVRIPNDGTQERFLDRPAGMNRHHGPNLLLGMNQAGTGTGTVTLPWNDGPSSGSASP